MVNDPNLFGTVDGIKAFQRSIDSIYGLLEQGNLDDGMFALKTISTELSKLINAKRYYERLVQSVEEISKEMDDQL